MTISRTRRLVFGGAAGIGILLGAAGISAAATSPSRPPAASSVKPATHPEKADNETKDSANEANGVDCQDGIIVATGANCDGGPAANKANDPNEAGQAKESEKESGKEEAKGADEADGVDHKADGNEVGDNGNGVKDANEAAETANG